MTRPLLALALTVATVTGASADDTDARQAPVLRPALYVLGAVDDAHGISGALDQELLEPPRSLSLGGALDALWEGRAARFQGSLFGILHSPFSDSERGYLLAGRVHAMRNLGDATRLTLDDSARLQRRSQLGLTDYTRNEAVLGVEWQPTRGPAWTFRLADRHRKVTELSSLGFGRQAMSLGATFTLTPRLRLAAEATAHHYSTDTVHGESGALTLELTHVSLRRTVSLRSAWFVPVSDRLAQPQAASDMLTYVVAPGGEATLVRGTGPLMAPEPVAPAEMEPVAADTLLLADGPVGRSTAGDSGLVGFADPFLFDPLESDTDEWSFGRHKQIVALLVSQRLAERTRVALVARYQHSSGPTLLVATTPGPDTRENRLWLRLTLRHQVWRQAAVFLHGGYLVNRSSDDAQDFTRGLLVGGLEIPF
jgi:hypothetical protein